MTPPQSTPVPALTRWVLWFALLGSIGAYFVILQTSGPAENPRPQSIEPLEKPFLLAGLVLMTASLGVRHFVARLVTPEGKRRVPEWIFPAFIVALALGEAPAILGLVLGFQGAEERDYLPLFVMAIIALASNAPLFFFPREES